MTVDYQGPARVTILGSTGSVGCSTLDIIDSQRAAFGDDCVEIIALTARSNHELLARQARHFRPRFVGIVDEEAGAALRARLADTGIEVGIGPDAVNEAAQRETDWAMAAIVGAAGLQSTLTLARCGTVIALANKESLVCAGALLTSLCKKNGSRILPVDSEHNAIFQVLDPNRKDALVNITLTASGGPFRNWSVEQMRTATPAQAVAHPVWSMGSKISVDSASLMNKGLELIEARHLFDVSSDQLAVLIHPQSVVHGLVEYSDGSILAQLGPADMRVPIASAFAWPNRIKTRCTPLSLAAIGTLEFSIPDVERFPALALARAALEKGDACCTALNAANEVAVEAFLAGRIGFLAIAALVDAVLQAAPFDSDAVHSLEEVVDIDKVARRHAREKCAQFQHP